MKDLINKIIANLHVFIFLYGLYTVYEMWDAHTISYTELETQIPGIEENIKKTEVKVKAIQDFVKKAEEYKVRVEEVAKSIESVQRQLPSETNDSQIIGFFQKDMGNLNIKDPAISPSPEEVGTYFISKNYTLKARGTFLQFLIFFERIGTASRIYNVRSLTLSNPGENKKGRFQVITAESVIQAYRFNPNFKVERAPNPSSSVPNTSHGNAE
jgi:Tfp pilus assembly protein PilO